VAAAASSVRAWLVGWLDTEAARLLTAAADHTQIDTVNHLPERPSIGRFDSGRIARRRRRRRQASSVLVASLFHRGRLCVAPPPLCAASAARPPASPPNRVMRPSRFTASRTR